ncbi:MAG: tRNA pseudouridine(38-40) synthase TruA [Acidobacteriota bacterium]
MVVYRLTLSYRGGAYHGWQRQANGRTVQEMVETALGELLERPITVHGASRTDAGVHARGQAAHLQLEEPFATGGLIHGTNRHLPADIRVLAADRMPDGFHAQRHAAGKEYRYRLIRGRILSPLDAPFAVPVRPEIDLTRLRRAAAALVGRHDFTAFALAGGSHQQPFRHIWQADWLENGRELVFRVCGDGFLRGMVRSLVGTQLDVGLGRRSPDSFAALLEGRPRSAGGPTAPAHGLCLMGVFYEPPWSPMKPDDMVT